MDPAENHSGEDSDNSDVDVEDVRDSVIQHTTNPNASSTFNFLQKKSQRQSRLDGILERRIAQLQNSSSSGILGDLDTTTSRISLPEIPIGPTSSDATSSTIPRLLEIPTSSDPRTSRISPLPMTPTSSNSTTLRIPPLPMGPTSSDATSSRIPPLPMGPTSSDATTSRIAPLTSSDATITHTSLDDNANAFLPANLPGNFFGPAAQMVMLAAMANQMKSAASVPKVQKKELLLPGSSKDNPIDLDTDETPSGSGPLSPTTQAAKMANFDRHFAPGMSHCNPNIGKKKRNRKRTAKPMEMSTGVARALLERQSAASMINRQLGMQYSLEYFLKSKQWLGLNQDPTTSDQLSTNSSTSSAQLPTNQNRTSGQIPTNFSVNAFCGNANNIQGPSENQLLTGNIEATSVQLPTNFLGNGISGNPVFSNLQNGTEATSAQLPTARTESFQISAQLPTNFSGNEVSGTSVFSNSENGTKVPTPGTSDQLSTDSKSAKLQLTTSDPKNLITLLLAQHLTLNSGSKIYPPTSDQYLAELLKLFLKLSGESQLPTTSDQVSTEQIEKDALRLLNNYHQNDNFKILENASSQEIIRIQVLINTLKMFVEQREAWKYTSEDLGLFRKAMTEKPEFSKFRKIGNSRNSEAKIPYATSDQSPTVLSKLESPRSSPKITGTRGTEKLLTPNGSVDIILDLKHVEGIDPKLLENQDFRDIIELILRMMVLFHNRNQYTSMTIEQAQEHEGYQDFLKVVGKECRKIYKSHPEFDCWEVLEVLLKTENPDILGDPFFMPIRVGIQTKIGEIRTMFEEDEKREKKEKKVKSSLSALSKNSTSPKATSPKSSSSIKNLPAPEVVPPTIGRNITSQNSQIHNFNNFNFPAGQPGSGSMLNPSLFMPQTPNPNFPNALQIQQMQNSILQNQMALLQNNMNNLNFNNFNFNLHPWISANQQTMNSQVTEFMRGQNISNLTAGQPMGNTMNFPSSMPIPDSLAHQRKKSPRQKPSRRIPELPKSQPTPENTQIEPLQATPGAPADLGKRRKWTRRTPSAKSTSSAGSDFEETGEPKNKKSRETPSRIESDPSLLTNRYSPLTLPMLHLNPELGIFNSQFGLNVLSAGSDEISRPAEIENENLEASKGVSHISPLPPSRPRMNSPLLIPQNISIEVENSENSEEMPALEKEVLENPEDPNSRENGNLSEQIETDIHSLVTIQTLDLEKSENSSDEVETENISISNELLNFVVENNGETLNGIEENPNSESLENYEHKIGIFEKPNPNPSEIEGEAILNESRQLEKDEFQVEKVQNSMHFLEKEVDDGTKTNSKEDEQRIERIDRFSKYANEQIGNPKMDLSKEAETAEVSKEPSIERFPNSSRISSKASQTTPNVDENLMRFQSLRNIIRTNRNSVVSPESIESLKAEWRFRVERQKSLEEREAEKLKIVSQSQHVPKPEPKIKFVSKIVQDRNAMKKAQEEARARENIQNSQNGAF